MCGLFIILALAGYLIADVPGLIIALLACIAIGVSKR